jgi:hypothetical protein
MIHSLEGWGTKQYWEVRVTILLLTQIPSTYPNREKYSKYDQATFC